MTIQTDNLRILETHSLIPPGVIVEDIPVSDKAADTVSKARNDISNILQGNDDRVIVVLGPCSVHDINAVMEYGHRLKGIMPHFERQLFIVMRVYFEKPRTTVGWKGFINDPDLDGSFKINKGLQLARKLLVDLTDSGIPCGTEFLDVVSPQYIADLVAWGAIGARTTESQVHRELASGLSCPVGFKNGTDGNVQIAVDAIKASHSTHHFLSITKYGNTAIFKTSGNKDTHVILRGGNSGPNYYAEHIEKTSELLKKNKLPSGVMVDCSHGNSKKDFNKQVLVMHSLCEQIAGGSRNIVGAMIESHLKEGSQSIDNKPLEYGKSITDACVSWEITVPMLEELAEAVETRRNRT